MSHRLARFLLWLGAMGSGAGLIYLGLSRLAGGTPIDIASLAVLGVAFAIGAALLGVGLLGLSLEVVQWINRVLPDPPPARIIEVRPNGAVPAGASPPNPPLPEKPRSDQRTILDVTPEYLIALFEDKLAIQANKLVAPYLGKWIYVSGPLGNVLGDKTFQVSLAYDPARRFFVYMYFDEAWRDRLAVLTPGQHITVLGRISEVDSTTVRLADCELVMAQPTAPAALPS